MASFSVFRPSELLQGFFMLSVVGIRSLSSAKGEPIGNLIWAQVIRVLEPTNWVSEMIWKSMIVLVRTHNCSHKKSASLRWSLGFPLPCSIMQCLLHLRDGVLGRFLQYQQAVMVDTPHITQGVFMDQENCMAYAMGLGIVSWNNPTLPSAIPWVVDCGLKGRNI